MKRFLLPFHTLEKKIWGDKVDANPIFATVSMLFIALFSAFVVFTLVLDMGYFSGWIILTIATILFGVNIYESIAYSSSPVIALLRSLLWAGITTGLTLLLIFNAYFFADVLLILIPSEFFMIESVPSAYEFLAPVESAMIP